MFIKTIFPPPEMLEAWIKTTGKTKDCLDLLKVVRKKQMVAQLWFTMVKGEEPP